MSSTATGPAGKELWPDPADCRPRDAASSAAAGLGICWAGDIAMEEFLAASDRLRRARAGQDLAAWVSLSGQPRELLPAQLGPGRPRSGLPSIRQRGIGQREWPATNQGAGVPADDDPGHDDPLAEDELRAAEAAVCPAMPASELAGHARLAPGPGLAARLGQARPGQMDEAGLGNSITGWRKLTSWAQAQELAAVGELGRRRGVMDDPEKDRDPARQLSAEFAPNEVAMALTLTQCAAEWWMNFAVSMSRRLPATWSALSEGTIDLARAKPSTSGPHRSTTTWPGRWNERFSSGRAGIPPASFAHLCSARSFPRILPPQSAGVRRPRGRLASSSAERTAGPLPSPGISSRPPRRPPPGRGSAAWPMR